MDTVSRNFFAFFKSKNWEPVKKIGRSIFYLIGIVTFFLYFWSFIGLLIGVFFFFFSSDNAWKRNGIVLTYAITFITLLIFYYNAFSPLNLAIWFGLGIFLTFFSSLLIVSILKRRYKLILRVKARITKFYEGL